MQDNKNGYNGQDKELSLDDLSEVSGGKAILVEERVPVCPRCQSEEITQVSKVSIRYRCDGCTAEFSTPSYKTKTHLEKKMY